MFRFFGKIIIDYYWCNYFLWFSLIDNNLKKNLKEIL